MSDISYIKTVIKDNFIYILAIFISYMTFITYNTFTDSQSGDPDIKNNEYVNLNRFSLLDITPYIFTLIYVFLYYKDTKPEQRLLIAIYSLAFIFIVFTLITILNIYEYRSFKNRVYSNVIPQYIFNDEVKKISGYDAFVHFSFIISMIMFFVFIFIVDSDIPMKTHLIIFVSIMLVIFSLPLIRLKKLGPSGEVEVETRNILSDMFFNSMILYTVDENYKIWNIIFTSLFILIIGILTYKTYSEYKKQAEPPAETTPDSLVETIPDSIVEAPAGAEAKANTNNKLGALLAQESGHVSNTGEKLFLTKNDKYITEENIVRKELEAANARELARIPK